MVDFDAAARIYRSCRKVGVTPRGMVDCLIASVAHRNGAALLAQDVDLHRVAQVIGIPLEPAALTDPAARSHRLQAGRRSLPLDGAGGLAT